MGNRHRHRRTMELFLEACELEPSERPRFLERACAGDVELRRRVDALLAADAGDPDLDSPVRQAAASLAGSLDESAGGRRPPERPHLAPPRTERFRIEGEIGRGGMGVVYRAVDSKLHRPVAIKVLPAELASDARRLERFEREARAIAALNHPNVATIHDLEEADGLHFLVLELIEGETLSERISGGALESAEARRVAAGIAAALEAAHANGVVHQDLKPHNVMLTPQGRVKVLDFGIAKRLWSSGRQGNEEGGAAPPPHSGTPGYMSPEQACGMEVDRRTDIWAFGCILFETLAGRPAFAGRTLQRRIQATLEDEPEWSALPGDTPSELVGLIRSCLQKEPRRRLADIVEARAKLEELPTPTSGAAPTGTSGRRHNLPRQLTSFIGRGGEVAQVREALASTSLLTLAGAGGCGKTRLCLRVAELVADDYDDGVRLLELGSQSEPALVPAALAALLEVGETPGRTLSELLIGRLESQEMLLVVDNCEHLLGACSELVAALLRACRRLRVLATSREPLGIAGERVYPVSPLAVPDAGSTSSLEDVLGAEAAQLFVERASQARAALPLCDADAPLVARICQRLDGIPLALELAAARARVLSVEQIAGRLDDVFRLAAGGRRMAPGRQQTLRSTLDWSHELLSEREQTLLRRLSVFAGGWTLEAAEQVCSGPEIDKHAILNLLTHLVDKSLVEVQNAGGTRYRLLETVCRYARDRLRESGEEETLRTRHRDHFLVLAEAAEPEFRGREQQRWLARLAFEEDNLRAALDWCRTGPGGDEPALRMAVALAPFWGVRGRWVEGSERLESALSRTGHAAAPLRARALAVAGSMAARRMDAARARVLIAEALSLYRELGDERGMARIQHTLGVLVYLEGDLNRARPLFEESLALGRKLGDERGVAACLNDLGNVAQSRGDLATARTLYEEALALNRKLGNREWEANNVGNLGVVAWEGGDLSEARRLYEKSLALFRELGDSRGISYSLTNLALNAKAQGDLSASRLLLEQGLALNRESGDGASEANTLNTLGQVALEQGDLEAARRLIGDGLRLAQELGDRLCVAFGLEHAAALALADGRPGRTARLLAAAETLRAALGAALHQTHDTCKSPLEAARAALGDEEFTSAWQAGSVLTPEAAVGLALEDP